MEIKQVTYRALKNLGNYENETIEAVADVGEGETPEETLAKVREWVVTQLGQAYEARDLQERVERLLAKERDYQGRVNAAKDRYEQARRFLESIGIPMPERWPRDDLPF